MKDSLKKLCDDYGLTPEGVRHAIETYQEIICEITGGRLSKLTYNADYILEQARRFYEEERATININDKIKVKLTAHGERIHLEYYYKYLKNMQLIKYCTPKKDTEGYTEYQLWEFANIFGEYLYNGAEQVIENNEMTLL